MSIEDLDWWGHGSLGGRMWDFLYSALYEGEMQKEVGEEKTSPAPHRVLKIVHRPLVPGTDGVSRTFQVGDPEPRPGFV